MTFKVARIITVIMLLWALGKHPYSYYTLLRFVVCMVTAYGAYFAAQIKKKHWIWMFGIIVLLFNPFLPIHLNRDIWQIIDIVVAIILLSSLFLLKNSKTSTME